MITLQHYTEANVTDIPYPQNSIAVKQKVKDVLMYNETIQLNSKISLTNIQKTRNIISDVIHTTTDISIKIKDHIIKYPTRATQFNHEIFDIHSELSACFKKLLVFFLNESQEGIGQFLHQPNHETTLTRTLYT